MKVNFRLEPVLKRCIHSRRSLDCYRVMVARVSVYVLVVLLQGCLSGITSIAVLSGHETIDPENVETVPMLVGARLGLVDGQVSTYSERFLVETLLAKFFETGVFQKINYPVAGNENVVFEIGGIGALSEKGNVRYTLKTILCAFTLMLVCLPYDKEFEFQLEVKAVSWPDGTVINRYRSTGKTRITFRAASEHQAESEATNRAITVAYNEIINMIKQDAVRYRLKVDRVGVPL